MMTAKSTVHRRAAVLLAFFWAVACLLPLGGRPMMRPDEFRYGEIPREMLVSGDWVVPHFVDFRYFEKPALGYQIHALSLKIFGENAFAVRLPSALSVLLTGALLYLLLARRSRDPWLPGLATMVCWGFGLVYGIGTFAVLDSLLCLMLTLCIVGFYCAWDAERRISRCGWLIVAGVGAGAAFLIKGFLAFAVPVVVIGPFLLWRKDFRKLFTMPWLPLLTALAVAAPWSWAIWRAEPDFWTSCVVEEHWKRFTSSTYDRDPQPFWYFIPILLGGILPSGLLAAAAWRGWKKMFFREPLMGYCLCWFVFPFLFFSASSCKLGTYILPCFPPLAVLLAAGLRRAMLSDGAWVRRVLGRVLGIFGGILAAAAVFGLIALALWRRFPQLPEIYAPRNVAPYLFLLVLLLYGAGLRRFRKGKTRRLLIWFLLGLAPLFALGMYSLPKGLLAESKTPVPGITACLAEIPVRSCDVVAAESSGLSAVAWCLKRTDLVLMNGKGEFRYALENYPEYEGRFFRAKDMDAFLASIRPRRLVLIVLRGLDHKTLPRGRVPQKVVSKHGVTIAVY